MKINPKTMKVEKQNTKIRGWWSRFVKPIDYTLKPDLRCCVVRPDGTVTE